MKIPETPPDIDQILNQLFTENNSKLLQQIFELSTPLDNKKRYSHWEKIKHLTPPESLSNEQWWAGIKLARRSTYRALPFKDKNGKAFCFSLPDEVLQGLHWIDQFASGHIGTTYSEINTETRDHYMMRSLIDEAISSSQLEGASTTRRVAKHMITSGRSPRNKSEQMIMNNFLAMRFIREYKNEDLTPAMILSLHEIVTEKTLEKEGAAGKLRTSKDNILVVNSDNSAVLHEPPKASELKMRLQKLCDFGNKTEFPTFIHPVIKAILLHFMLAYDHPFVDGNGRTARALFYWSMAHDDYWLVEFLSISKMLKGAPAQYGKAYLYTETDDNDATYFILHQLDVIKKAIIEFQNFIDSKIQQKQKLQKIISHISNLEKVLNYRQIGIIQHALENPGTEYLIRIHQNSYDVTYQTARTDLLELSEKYSLLEKVKNKRTFVFIAPDDLKSRLKNM